MCTCSSSTELRQFPSMLELLKSFSSLSFLESEIYIYMYSSRAGPAVSRRRRGLPCQNMSIKKKRVGWGEQEGGQM